MMLHRIGWLAIGLTIASSITWAATGSETARTVGGWAGVVVMAIGLVFMRERLELRDRSFNEAARRFEEQRERVERRIADKRERLG